MRHNHDKIQKQKQQTGFIVTVIQMMERGKDCEVKAGNKIYRYGQRYNVISEGRTGAGEVIDLRGTWEPEPCELRKDGRKTKVQFRNKEYNLSEVLESHEML